MASTLILALFGGSLGIWVLDYVYDLPCLQLINSNSIGIEIMKAFSGSYGVIVTAPLACCTELHFIDAETGKIIIHQSMQTSMIRRILIHRGLFVYKKR